jgi:hypothetical protein
MIFAASVPAFGALGAVAGPFTFNAGVGLGWTIVIVACAVTDVLGASGALVAGPLHNSAPWRSWRMPGGF